ncbi:hypothetical protein N0V90_000017 [Kalmusia sp. IMI 367209]|nr:hypothetical protein N0V90_000017 [Kalmusia sp. IMI 367209]
MHFYIVRMPDRVDVNIRDWIIPRRKVIVALTTVAHMDATVWDTGADNEHRVDQFWAGRFLRYPAGQRTDRSGVENHTSDATLPTAPTVPTFLTKYADGAWIPYGGGPRQYPGRHFAKRQILLTTALFVSLFDCEMLGRAKNMGENFSLKGFGGGVSYPAAKVPKGCVQGAPVDKAEIRNCKETFTTLTKHNPQHIIFTGRIVRSPTLSSTRSKLSVHWSS